MQAWMNSPGHRDNILNPSYREVGVGIAVGNPARSDGAGATYATAFGALEAPAAAPPRQAVKKAKAKAKSKKSRAARRRGKGRRARQARQARQVRQAKPRTARRSGTVTAVSRGLRARIAA